MGKDTRGKCSKPGCNCVQYFKEVNRPEVNGQNVLTVDTFLPITLKSMKLYGIHHCLFLNNLNLMVDPTMKSLKMTLFP